MASVQRARAVPQVVAASHSTGTSAPATTTVSPDTARMAVVAAQPVIARVNRAHCLASSVGADWFPLDRRIRSRSAPSRRRSHAARPATVMASGRARAGPPKPRPVEPARARGRLCAIPPQSAMVQGPVCHPNWSIVRRSFVWQGIAPRPARATRTATLGMPASSRTAQPAEAAERESPARPATARTSASPGSAWKAPAEAVH